jgi:hypothetical protein
MSNRKSFFAGIGVSSTIGVLLLMLSGAVIPKSQNHYENMGSNVSSAPVMHVACSADGSVVYLSDKTRVMRSRNYGSDWQIVMTRFKSESSQE